MSTFRVALLIPKMLDTAGRTDEAAAYRMTPDYQGALVAKSQEKSSLAQASGTGAFWLASGLVGGAAAGLFAGGGAAAVAAPVAESAAIYPAAVGAGEGAVSAEAADAAFAGWSASSAGVGSTIANAAGGVAKSVATSLALSAFKPKGTTVGPADKSLAPVGRMFNAPASDRVKWGSTSSALAAGPDDGAFLKLISLVAGALALAGLVYKVAT